jgi:hypothetical protein
MTVREAATEESTCRMCGRRFGTPGVVLGDEQYCCAACGRGERCVCPEQLLDGQEPPGPREGDRPMGVP